jgi:hypothetical protein
MYVLERSNKYQRRGTQILNSAFACTVTLHYPRGYYIRIVHHHHHVNGELLVMPDIMERFDVHRTVHRNIFL